MDILKEAFKIFGYVLIVAAVAGAIGYCFIQSLEFFRPILGTVGSAAANMTVALFIWALWTAYIFRKKP